MAANLAKAGHEVMAFDLSPDALARAKANGCSIADSAETAVAHAEAVVTMLPAGKHVAEVYRSNVLLNAPKTAILMDCSTIAVATAKAVAGEAGFAGFEMVDAPVSGGIAAAEGGTLTFMVGGTSEAFAKAQPLLDQMGRPSSTPGRGRGQAARSATTCCGATMAATCERSCWRRSSARPQNSRHLVQGVGQSGR